MVTIYSTLVHTNLAIYSLFLIGSMSFQTVSSLFGNDCCFASSFQTYMLSLNYQSSRLLQNAQELIHLSQQE